MSIYTQRRQYFGGSNDKVHADLMTSLSATIILALFAVMIWMTVVIQHNKNLESDNAAYKDQSENDEETIEVLKRGRAVDVVFLFDTSGSMELQNSRVRRAIGLVGELLPRVTTLRVGVLTFQQSGYKTFPLQELKRPDTDQGASRAKLAAFLNEATVANGLVDVADATQRGMAMFDAAANRF